MDAMWMVSALSMASLPQLSQSRRGLCNGRKESAVMEQQSFVTA
jgi:hypothetical protein